MDQTLNWHDAIIVLVLTAGSVSILFGGGILTAWIAKKLDL